MNLEIIRTQTTWNDAAGSINSNYAKIADAIAQLKANDGADIDLSAYATKVWVEAKGYITASALTPYALKTDIPSLDGYATEDFVNNKLGDYATKDFVNNKLANYATTDSVTAIQNTLTGRIGAVNASVEQLAVTKLDSSYFTLTNIKSTLGISDWALAATKPSYAWSEITSRPTALSQFTDDVVDGKYLHSVRYSDNWDADSIYDAGIFSGRISNLPSGEPYGRILSLPYYNDKDNATQNFVAHLFITNGDDSITPNEMFFRTAQRNAWNAWNKVITDKNISNYNAGSATKLQTPRTLWGKSFDGTADVSGNIYGDIWRVIKDSTWDGTFIQSANYDGTSDFGNIYISARNGKKLTSFNVWATNSIFSDNIISPRFETTAFSASTPKRKAALDSGGLIVYGADNSGWASGIYARNPDDNTDIGAIAAAFGNSSYTPLFYYYGGAYNDPFLKIYQNDRRIISSGLFMNIGKEISPYASNRTEIALINPNAEPSMLRLGSNGDVKWGIETRGSTDNYAFSIYSWTEATHCLRILNNGNVGIGNISPTEKLDVAGNIKASGNINATSITINGVTITASNGSITVNGNVLATGAITAKKVG